MCLTLVSSETYCHDLRVSKQSRPLTILIYDQSDLCYINRNWTHQWSRIPTQSNDIDQSWMCSIKITCNVIHTSLFPTGPTLLY